MTCKECIDIIDELIRKTDMPTFVGEESYDTFVETWATIKAKYDIAPITEKGANILKYMAENADTYNNIFTAKTIGEGVGVNSKTVSGSIRKLVADGFVERKGGTPVAYAITPAGVEMSRS